MESDWKGIPDGYAWPRLSYDPTSGIVVVELHSKTFGAGFVPTRLFSRDSEQTEYRPVVDWDSQFSSESIVFAGDSTHAAFNSVEYTRLRDDQVSGDWNGLFLWNIATSVASCLVDRNTLKVPSGFSRAWPTNVLALPSDMRHLYCSLGLQRDDGRCSYHVAAISLETRTVNLLSDLKATFY